VDSEPLSDAGDSGVAASARVKLVLSLMAGRSGFRDGGPHVTICSGRGAHNISTAEWTVSAILAMLKHFPFFLEMQASGEWKRRFEQPANYARITETRVRCIRR